jgi:hypothetical protein
MMYFHSSAARMVAPAVIGGSGLSSLSEPLIPKNDETLPEQEEEEAPIPLSSIGVIIGLYLYVDISFVLICSCIFDSCMCL